MQKLCLPVLVKIPGLTRSQNFGVRTSLPCRIMRPSRWLHAVRRRMTFCPLVRQMAPHVALMNSDGQTSNMSDIDTEWRIFYADEVKSLSQTVNSVSAVSDSKISVFGLVLRCGPRFVTMSNRIATDFSTNHPAVGCESIVIVTAAAEWVVSFDFKTAQIHFLNATNALIINLICQYSTTSATACRPYRHHWTWKKVHGDQ